MVNYNADKPTPELLEAMQTCFQERGIRIYDGPYVPTRDTLDVTVILTGELKKTILISLRDADHPEVGLGEGKETNVTTLRRSA